MKNAQKISLLIGAFLLVLFLGALFWITPSDPQESLKKPVVSELTEIQMGYIPVPQPLFIAKEKKFFEEEGIRVNLVEFPNANANLEAMARGDVHGSGSIAYFTLFPFELKSPGFLTTFVSGYETKEKSWSQLIVKKDRAIKEPKDFRGKKIAMRAGLSSKIQADAVFKGMGLDLSTLTYVQVNPDLLISTFSNPEVDAFLDIQPFGTILLNQQLGELFADHPRADYIMDPYPLAAGVLTRDFVLKHPEETKRFVKAIEKAIDFIETNEADSRQIYTSYLKLDADVANKMPLFQNVKLKDLDRSAIESLVTWAFDYELIEKKPNLQTFFLEQ